MKNTLPFTYLLRNRITGMCYYGVRYAIGCHPSDMMSSYFSSSYIVNQKIQTGDTFDLQIRKTFPEINGIEKAKVWEQKVNRRLTVKSNKFYNTSSIKSIAMPGTVGCFNPKTLICCRTVEIPDQHIKGYGREHRLAIIDDLTKFLPLSLTIRKFDLQLKRVSIEGILHRLQHFPGRPKIIKGEITFRRSSLLYLHSFVKYTVDDLAMLEYFEKFNTFTGCCYFNSFRFDFLMKNPRFWAIIGKGRLYRSIKSYCSNVILTSDQQIILSLYKKNVTMKNIGKQLGVTEGRVSQQLNKIHSLMYFLPPPVKKKGRPKKL